MNVSERQDQIKSELFVGRGNEFDRFKGFIQSGSNVDVLNIYANGDGGIGKTQLSLQMLKYKLKN